MNSTTVRTLTLFLVCLFLSTGCSRSGNTEATKADPDANSKADATIPDQTVPPTVRPSSAELFVNGSVWRGSTIQVKSKSHVPTEVIVVERDGDKFKADLRTFGKHTRNIEGTVVDGTIKWYGAPGETNRGWHHVGTINGARIELKGFSTPDGKVEDGSCELDYVPPDKQ